jgi:Protein of unknown function (DUF2612)
VSGPPYPRPGGAGSNAIGSFIIGVSPIGSLPSFDVWTTVISQYANSDILTGLIVDWNNNLDQTADFENFYDFIWNIDTAQGFGLDILGRIIGVGRVLHIAAGDYFGFEEALPGSEPFGGGSFYSGGGLTNSFALSDDAYRVLLFAKALSNISDGSIKSINQLLKNLFPNRGNTYVIDNNDMTLVYYFNFPLSVVELAIMGQSGVLPKPTGVASSIVTNPPS